jgi:O-antigen/teichoic acid export membrane protein
MVLNFVVRTVFIYTLGKQYLGINGLFSDILSMLSLANLGIGTAIVYRLYAPLAHRDLHRVRVLVKFYKLAYKLIGCVIFGLGLLVIPFLPVLIKDYATLADRGIHGVQVFILFLINSAASYWFLAYRTSVINANQERYLVQIFNVIAHVLTCIAKILILVLIRDFMVYTAVGIGIGIAVSLVRGVYAKRLHPEFFGKEQDSLSKQEITEMLKDCGALLIFNINGVVIKASDNMVLSAFIGLETVGLYSNYLLFYHTCISVFSQILTSFKASLGNLYATAAAATRFRFFKISSFLMAVVFGTAAVGVAVCSNELIMVWIGSDYVIPQPLSILFGIELYFVGVLNSLGQMRHVSGIFRQMWFRPILSMIVNIVVSIVLAQVWGVCGVTVGTIATYVLTNYLFDPHLIYKYTFEGYKPVSDYYVRSLTYLAILTAICAVDMLICSHFFVGHGWFSVIVHVIITGASVPAVFAALFWKTDECKYLVKLSSGILTKAKKKLIR